MLASRLLGQRDTLRVRLVLFSLAIALPLLLLIGLGLRTKFTDDRAAALERLRMQRIVAARTVADYLNRAQAKLAEMEAIAGFTDLSSPATHEACRLFLRLHPEFINLAVVDRSGTMHFSTAFPVTNPPQNYRSLPGFADQLAHLSGFEVSAAARGPTTGRWGVVLAKPLAHRPDLVFAAPVDLQRLSETLFLGPDTAELILSVTDRAGTIVLSSYTPHSRIGEVRLTGKMIRERLAAGQTGGEFIGIDGVQRTYEAALIPSADWLLTVAVPNEVIYHDAKQNLALLLVILTLVVVGASFFVRHYARSLVLPVRALAQVAREHAAGHHDRLAPVRGPAEIADTASAFNEMVAARQRAEAGLAESEQRYRTVVEQTGQLVYQLDFVDGRIHWFGADAAHAITGLPITELQSMRLEQWAHLIHPDDAPRVRDYFLRQRKATGPYHTEYRVRHTDGSYRLLEDVGIFLPGENDRHSRALGRLSDITARTQALRESTLRQRLLRQIIDLVPHFIFAKDRDGHFLIANESLARAHGITPEEMIGRTDADFHPDSAEAAAYRATDLEVIDGWQSRYVAEEAHTDSHGTRRVVSTIKIPFHYPGPQGDIPAVLGVAVDITELKAAQDQRQQIEKKLLETQKLESLGVLAGGIAHDFNNLLTGVLGNTGLARLSLTPDHDAQEYLFQIERASQRAADLCKQMLAYSGKGRFVVQSLDLDELVRDSLELLNVSISKKAQIRFNPGGPLPAIQADVTQLRQIVMNLVINASEALEDRTGQITLTTGTQDIDAAYLATLQVADSMPPGHAVFLEVSDNGCGMSRETLTRIFDPFYTTKFTGRGLGLAAVLGIVRGHKGAIKVYSNPGAGTTFRVLFPAVSGSTQPVVRAAIEPPLWRGAGHILVVDDEEAVRHVATGILHVLGFTAESAPDGAVGLERFRHQPDRYAAVLLDLTMPNLDGEETFRQLRLLRPDAKVILMSGFNRVDAINRFVGKGLAGFIQKPFQVETLAAELRRVLDHTPPET